MNRVVQKQIVKTLCGEYANAESRSYKERQTQ